MAWLWWLLAPLASTVVGGFVLMLRGRGDLSRSGRRDPIADHRALLAALPQPKAGEPEPVTMLVLDPDHSGSTLG